MELDTSGTLIVTRGDQAALTVTAGEKVIARLTSEVDAGVLRCPGIHGADRRGRGDPITPPGTTAHLRSERVASTPPALRAEPLPSVGGRWCHRHMTDVLILGGTGWLSSRIARRWQVAGARVTCLARGERPAPDGAVLVRADRDEAGAYDLLDRDWDEVVDVSSHAAQVQAAVAALGHRTAHWTYVSSMSVYVDADEHGADETARLEEPAQPDNEYEYAAQKVAAELAVQSLGGRAHIIRPGLIVGPGDPSDRFGYWAAAFDRAGAGAVLTPSTDGRFAQVIDVDDLAAFAASTRLSGVHNAIGDPHPLAEVLAAFRTATAHTGATVAAEDDWLEAHGVEYWMGERSLPLWLPMKWSAFSTRSNAAYRAAGGVQTPLETVIDRVVADERVRGIDRPRRAGLMREDEEALLAARA